MGDIATIISLEMTMRMAKAKIYDRLDDALLHEDRLEVLQATERITLELVDEIMKSDEEIILEIGVEGLQAKDEVFKAIVTSNYEFLGFPELNPFECGKTIEEVKMRNL